MNSKEKKRKFYPHVLIYLISYLVVFVLGYFIFKKCLAENNIINVISIGSILATFGSAVLSVFLVIENDTHNRILRNIDILYTDILKQKSWRRWQFLKREKINNYGNTIGYSQTLENPYIIFNTGLKNIKIYIPTVKEDFYDLPSFTCFFSMIRYNKRFKIYMINKKDIIKNEYFSDNFDCILGWDCLYDIWEKVILFRLSRFLLNIGACIVIASLIFSFLSKYLF